MSFNGSGQFNINTAGQPVVTGTTISSTAFNALTADLATGLTTCITKDGQTTPTANIPMGGNKLTGLGAATTAGDAVRYEQWTGAADIGLCEFRPTLTSGLPVTTADVTAATTLYVTPYGGNRIALYDGSATWTVYSSAEMSIAVPATTNTVYDIFCYANSGTPTLELTAWTNDTTRATALTLQNGVYVKSGATTRRYIGSFRTTGVSGQTEDSIAKRYVWSYYNRVSKPMRVVESTSSWTYTTATFRQANGAAANQLDFVIGVSEDNVKCVVHCAARSNTGAGTVNMIVGVGIDSTSVNNATNFAAQANYATSIQQDITAVYENFSAVGRHTLVWLEYSTASGTTTWFGTNNPQSGSGISGELRC